LENIREKLSIILPFSRKMVNDSEESLTVSMIPGKSAGFLFVQGYRYCSRVAQTATDFAA
jgi:hypothetical protein